MTTADRIRNRRLELGLTQLEVAKRLGLTSKAAVSKVEGQGDNVTLKNVEKFAKALNCSKAYLMGWDKEEKINENDILEKAAADIQRAVNKSMSEEDKQLQVFTEYYKKLNPEQRTLVDNLLIAFLKKQ